MRFMNKLSIERRRDFSALRCDTTDNLGGILHEVGAVSRFNAFG